MTNNYTDSQATKLVQSVDTAAPKYRLPTLSLLQANENDLIYNVRYTY